MDKYYKYNTNVDFRKITDSLYSLVLDGFIHISDLQDVIGVVTEKIQHGRSTIAEMDFVYAGKSYHYEQDFGVDYPEDAVWFIFFEGNYSCDCNKSLFIRRTADENFPKMMCGDEIKIENFKIILK